MPKKPSLVESIKSSLPSPRTSVQPWHERVPADVLEELKSLRAEWHSGAFDAGAKTLATAISRRLREDNISTIGHQGVLAWLKRTD